MCDGKAREAKRDLNAFIGNAKTMSFRYLFTLELVWQCTFKQRILTYFVRESITGLDSTKQVKLLINLSVQPENTHRWGKDHCTAGLQFNKNGTDQ